RRARRNGCVAFRLFGLFVVGLTGLQISDNRLQHFRGVIAKRGQIHRLPRQPGVACERDPLGENWFGVRFDEFRESQSASVGRKRRVELASLVRRDNSAQDDLAATWRLSAVLSWFERPQQCSGVSPSLAVPARPATTSLFRMTL